MPGRKILSVIPNLIYWVFCSGPVLCGVRKVLAKGARKRRWINFLHILPADWFSTNVHISFLGGKYWVSYRIWFSELFHHLVNHRAFFIEVLFLRWGWGWHDHLKNKSGFYNQPADTFTNRTVLFAVTMDGWLMTQLSNYWCCHHKWPHPDIVFWYRRRGVTDVVGKVLRTSCQQLSWKAVAMEGIVFGNGVLWCPP